MISLCFCFAKDTGKRIQERRDCENAWYWCLISGRCYAKITRRFSFWRCLYRSTAPTLHFNNLTRKMKFIFLLLQDLFQDTAHQVHFKDVVATIRFCLSMLDSQKSAHENSFWTQVFFVGGTCEERSLWRGCVCLWCQCSAKFVARIHVGDNDLDIQTSPCSRLANIWVSSHDCARPHLPFFFHSSITFVKLEKADRLCCCPCFCSWLSFSFLFSNTLVRQ